MPYKRPRKNLGESPDTPVSDRATVAIQTFGIPTDISGSDHFLEREGHIIGGRDQINYATGRPKRHIQHGPLYVQERDGGDKQRRTRHDWKAQPDSDSDQDD